MRPDRTQSRQSVAPMVQRVTIASVDPTRMLCVVRNSVGKDFTIDYGIDRTSVIPSPGEGWLIDRTLGAWTLAARLGVTPTPAPTGGSPVRVDGYVDWPISVDLQEESDTRQIHFGRPFNVEAWGYGGNVTISGSEQYPIMLWQGEWDATRTSYNWGDVVTKNGKLYVVKAGYTGSADPETFGQPMWTLLADLTGGGGAGFDASADPVVIGSNAEANGYHYGVAIGMYSFLDGDYAAAIGRNAEAAQYGASFGFNSWAQGTYSVAVGMAHARESEDVAVGHSAYAYGGHSVAVGPFAQSGAAGGVAVGEDSYAGANSATAVGPNTYIDTNGTSAVAVGDSAAATAAHTIAVGEASSAIAAYAIAVGRGATAQATQSTALGDAANATNTHSTAIGANAYTDFANQIKLGTADDFVEIPGNGIVMLDTTYGVRVRLTIAGGVVHVDAA